MGFSDMIRSVLKQKGITITDLAKKMGYTVQYVSDLLKGDRRWNETTMNKACDVLSIEVAYKIPETLDPTA
jgi:transcriptional regulator with XRE-family HTH domain